jgi:hypothetical protein
MEEIRNCFGETRKEEETRRKAGERKKGRGRGHNGQIPPWKPLTDPKFVSCECWEEGDTGIPRRSPYHHPNPFTSFVGYAADELDRQNGKINNSEDEREAGRDPEWDSRRVAKAGANLMETLELASTRAMCAVVGAYMGRLECRMDGVIDYCLRNRNDSAVADAAVAFAGKMEKYLPDISKQARDRLIAEAQRERQFQKRTDGLAYRLGKTIFNNNWDRLLRAAV